MMTDKDKLLYAATSANLFNFLGHDNIEEHMEIFKGSVKNALDAHIDVQQFASESVEIIDPARVMDSLKDKVPIFITFHAGSYNMLASLLMKEGYFFSVLSDTNGLNNSDYQQLSALYDGKYKNNCGFTMLNVEQEGMIFSIIRKIKQGHITLAYLDGNKGIGGQTKTNENMLKIPFLNGVLIIRKGLAYMSFLTKTPLVLVLNYQENGKKYIRFYDPITSEKTDKEEYCVDVLGQVFDNFQEYIKVHYKLWSYWPYLHIMADLSAFMVKNSPSNGETGNIEWKFNSSRYLPLKMNGEYFLFDKLEYIVHPVKEEDISLFSLHTSREARNNLIRDRTISNTNKIADLISRKILIPENATT